MPPHTIYCSACVEYKNDRANEQINSEIFPLTALNFQFVMKDKVSVYVEPSLYESDTDVTMVTS